MAVKKILVEINSEGDIDIEDYIAAIEDACDEVERRPMIGSETTITVREVTNG